MEDKFDKTKFAVNFESVVTNKKMGAAFYKFLKSEHNAEGYDFMMEFKNLETLKDVKQLIEKTKHIFTSYVLPNSSKEINISGELRSKTISNFEKQTEVSDKWILEVKPKELLQECFHVIASVLRHDPFKRFIRTEECEKIMKQFQNDSSVVTPIIAKNYAYQVNDFKNPYIDDKDFDFFKALMEDGYNWKVRFFFLLMKVNWLKNFRTNECICFRHKIHYRLKYCQNHHCHQM
jgi:hypothetical protein